MIPVEPDADSPYDTPFRTRLTRVVLLATLIAWTSYWLRHAIPLVQQHTRIGSGTWGPVLDGHDIFEFVFVASHCLVRWAPGALLIVGVLLVMRWRNRRARLLSAPV